MADLVWTEDKPEKEGWYWTQKDSTGRKKIVEVRKYYGMFCIEQAALSDFARWAGPIAPPLTEEQQRVVSKISADEERLHLKYTGKELEKTTPWKRLHHGKEVVCANLKREKRKEVKRK